LDITHLFTHLTDYEFVSCSINYAHQVVMVGWFCFGIISLCIATRIS